MAQDRNEDNKRTNIAHPAGDLRDSQGPTQVLRPTQPTQDSGATQIVGISPRLPQKDAPPVVDTPPPPEMLTKGPVVGWLVVVAGPGRGAAREVYVGRNSIGRDPHNRIAIDFGDQAMSREKAAFLAYDPVDNSFTVIPGEGTNIPRHNKAAVHGPQPMAAGDTLTIGQTELRFVPLCGPDFQWEQG